VQLVPRAPFPVLKQSEREADSSLQFRYSEYAEPYHQCHFKSWFIVLYSAEGTINLVRFVFIILLYKRSRQLILQVFSDIVRGWN